MDNDEIVKAVATVKRWCPIIDGNGSKPLDTRLTVIEKDQERNNRTMENLLESTESLKTVTRGMKKEYESSFNTKRRIAKDFVQWLVIVIMALALFGEKFWDKIFN
jgi:hypothetical protein